jgi:hypothetical protein
MVEVNDITPWDFMRMKRHLRQSGYDDEEAGRVVHNEYFRLWFK